MEDEVHKSIWEKFDRVIVILLLITVSFSGGYAVRDIQASKYQRSDVNHDGKVDLQDASIVLGDLKKQ